MIDPHPWLRASTQPEWIKARLAEYVGIVISPLQILAGMPQPRDWVFVGRTDNGPRGAFHFEIVCLWRN